MLPACALWRWIESTVSFSALGLDGSLCLLIKLLPFSELAQEPGQRWAREDLGRQRRGNVAKTSDPRGLFCTPWVQQHVAFLLGWWTAGNSIFLSSQ